MNQESIASRGRGRGRKSDSERQEMRRPNESNNIVHMMEKLYPYTVESVRPAPNVDGWSSGENKHDYDPIPSFNVSASEFVPKSDLNVTAQEFVPRTIARNTSTWGVSYNTDLSTDNCNIDPLSLITSALQDLLIYPENFKSTVLYLTENLSHHILNEELMSSIVNYTFETCIRDVTFHYTGAQLCRYISLLTTDEGKTFEDVLLEKCIMEHNMQTQSGSDDLFRLRSFTQFLAELFLVLFYFDGEKVLRFSYLRDFILQQLNLLLITSTEKDNLKAVVQTLKLAGRALEEDEKTVNENQETPLMNDLMKLIIKVSEDTSIESHMAACMAHLPQLREKNWGIGSDSNGLPEEYIDGSLFNTTGVEEGIGFEDNESESGPELTAEEYEFMNAQLDNCELDNLESEEMTEEVEAAFGDFLKSQIKN